MAPVSSPTSSEDATLRREAGRLAATLAARRTQPPRLFLRLQVEVSSAGSLVDRSRTLDLTRLRSGKTQALRVRFRAPEGLAGQAILLREEAGARRAWRYDPQRQQSEPIKWPSGGQGLGGTGLTWSDLWGHDPSRWRYRLEGEEELSLGPKPIRVLRVQALGLAGAKRLLHLERDRRLPICVEEVGPGGRRQVWRSGWVERKETWISTRWRITSATSTSRVEVREHRLEAPAAHLDPSRFQRN